MNANITVTKSQSVRAFYLFFIIHTIQIGAGLMGVPRILFLEAGSDAWVSILIGGLYIHFIAWIMILILREYENADILGIQCDLFGAFFGKLMGCIFIIYIFFILLSVIRNYIEVVQVFIFPEIPIWLMTLFLLFLMIYCVSGGLRVVIGTCFLFFFLTIWLVFTIYTPVTYMDWGHFLPVFQSSPLEILKGSQKMTYTVLGMEVLLFVYPYIENKKKIAVPVHLAIVLTTFLILLVTVVSIGYFSDYQLRETVWATLSLFKIVSFSIIERFDFIAVAIWMMVIIPNIVLFCWILLHSVKRMFNFQGKRSLYVIAVFLFIGSILFEYRMSVNQMTDLTAQVGFYLVFVYPLFLYLVLQVRKIWRKRRAS
ncbi:GerAB/ArcD/ProY family transporter [Halobacillus locisalis]|uniref:GerAB/ArcD/ProY family transporter n=1 Tax=Halobacillus locisalis TaxID=220753 RepID=A0A838CR81_9BACI|nr:GerAB/ArcD/ProY family transporter [Halobacillus locisalis]MBA2174642.1 GerAB/ArcD/ProY family transporter [Halobacillus locisalis]